MVVTKRYRKISTSLQLATCTLLSSAPGSSQAGEADSEWLIDGSVLSYDEKDRVQVIAPVVSGRKYLQHDEFKEYRLTIDAMTGATPNGATPSNVPQTFTGASGQSGYTVPANETPMRDFEDLRVAFNYASQTPIDNISRESTGLALSLEEDYGSFGLNQSYSKDLDDKHTTLTAGAGVSLDLVFPDGGAPDGLSNINATSGQGGRGDDDDDDDEGEGEGDDFDPEFKGTFDVLLGVTQVISRNILMQLNYTHGFLRGYLTDPYKVVSVVDSDTGEPFLTPNTNDGVYLYEQRPEERDTNSIFWQTIINLSGDVMRLSYRYFWDDWGIESHTVDVKYRFEFAGKFFIQPHYRFYTQTAADFYRHSLRDTDPMPDYVSADYRLAEFDGETIGVKFGVDYGNKSTFDVILEKYTQTGDSYPDDAVGIQRNYDLYPKLEATIIQVSFSKIF